MVTSIVLTGMYDIGISANNKIKTPDGTVIDLKDVPFVRYRFEKYGEEELKFIANNKKKFKCVHLVEIDIAEDTPAVIDKLNEISKNIAVMLYVDVTDQVVVDKTFSDEMIEWMENAADCTFERINLRDKSTSMFNSDLDILKKETAQIMGVRPKEVGVCGGPLCFMDGNACITAVKAREILANYSDTDDVVVPSANHEAKIGANESEMNFCLNKCGCIRYHVFNCDTAAPASKSVKAPGETKKVKVTTPDGEKDIEKKDKETKEKKPKAPKLKGYVEVDW